ncbi:hypothetical protein PF008_g28062 [Phytophthora fragariae]|nr:hypothetical protein PF008_g28062 [Phytophthora fragariae]
MEAAIISLSVEAIVQVIVRKHKKHEGIAPVYRQTKEQIPRAAAVRRRSRLVLKQEGELY